MKGWEVTIEGKDIRGKEFTETRRVFNSDLLLRLRVSNQRHKVTVKEVEVAE